MQNTVGKHMAAFGVGRQLALINRHELHLAANRHGFGGANKIARFGRQNFLFASNESQICLMHVAEIAAQAAVIDLARQKPQRQANHAAGMGQ